MINFFENSILASPDTINCGAHDNPVSFDWCQANCERQSSCDTYCWANDEVMLLEGQRWECADCESETLLLCEEKICGECGGSPDGITSARLYKLLEDGSVETRIEKWKEKTEFEIRFKMEGRYFIKADGREEAEEAFYGLDMKQQFDEGIERSEILEVNEVAK